MVYFVATSNKIKTRKPVGPKPPRPYFVFGLLLWSLMYALTTYIGYSEFSVLVVCYFAFYAGRMLGEFNGERYSASVVKRMLADALFFECELEIEEGQKEKTREKTKG